LEGKPSIGASMKGMAKCKRLRVTFIQSRVLNPQPFAAYSRQDGRK